MTCDFLHMKKETEPCIYKQLCMAIPLFHDTPIFFFHDSAVLILKSSYDLIHVF